VGTAAEILSGVGVALAHCVGVRAGALQQACRGGVWGLAGDSREVASGFCELRLDGLCDEPRPGRPATISAEQVEDVVVATLESVPNNATHWSRSKMAERSGLSKSTIGRIWRAFGLQPHRTEHFKLSNDPLFVEKVYDVVGLSHRSARVGGGAVRG